MNRIFLAAAALAATTMLTTPAAAGGHGVNIIYPPQMPAQPEPAAKPKAKKQVNVKVKIVLDPHVYYVVRRHQRAKRALYQTWTGFHKGYSGRRYPF